jgi:hypothetical protein
LRVCLLSFPQSYICHGPHYKYLHHSVGSKISGLKYTLLGGKDIIIFG